MRPVVCMITDRHRTRSGDVDGVVERVATAARAGVQVIQVRERDLDGGPLLSLVRRCVEAVAETRARVVVNDRVDVAIAAQAHGVHLRGDSMPATRVRSVAPPEFLVGRSVHARDEAVRAADDGGLDYLIWGPVFATGGKQPQAGGLSELTAVAAATPLPVLAVGGISTSTVAALAKSGVSGFAAIGMFADTPEAQLREIINGRWPNTTS